MANRPLTAKQRERDVLRCTLNRVRVIAEHASGDRGRCGIVAAHAQELPRMLAAYARAIRRTKDEQHRRETEMKQLNAAIRRTEREKK